MTSNSKILFDDDFIIDSDVNEDLVYEIDLSYILNVSTDYSVRLINCSLVGSRPDGSLIPLGSWYTSDQGVEYVKSHNFERSDVIYLKGSDLTGLTLCFRMTSFWGNEGAPSITYDVTFTPTINNITALSSSESADYESGYNAGYSDGLLDGAASVDIDAISNEAYQAGYEAGFADGSDDTLKEDKVLIDTVSGSFDMNGHVLISQTKQYADPEDLFFGYGYASDVVPIFHQYDFNIGKDYLIDFKRLSVRNSEPTYDISSGELVDGYVSILPSFSLSGPGLHMSDLGELIYSPNQTGDTDLSVSVRGDMTMIGEWDDGIDNDYVYIPENSFALGSMDWVTTVTYEIDVYEIDIVEEIDYLRDQSNKLGDLNNTQQEALDVSKETQATTKGIFESIKEFFGSFFQNLVDSVLGLFVPSTEEMSGLFDQLNQFFSDRFGFLYAPFDYMIQLLDVFVTSTGDTGITFPGFSIMGYEVWPDMTYDISEDPLVGQIFEYVRMGTGILLAGWFIMYLQNFFKERFSQG